jgi:transposase
MPVPDELSDRARARQDKRQRLRAHGTLNPHPERVTDPLFDGQAFFDADDLVQVRYEMLRRVGVDAHTVLQATQAFGFTRPVYYQARAAYDRDGLAGLVPGKRGPKGGHKLTAEVMDFVEQLAHREVLPGPELARRVAERFGVQVHPRSIERARGRRKKKRPRE